MQRDSIAPLEHGVRKLHFIDVQSLIFSVLCIIDGIFTYVATNLGYHEDNPFMSPIAASPVYPLLKFAAALAGLIVINQITKRYPQLKNLMLVTIALVSILYVGILVRNISQL